MIIALLLPALTVLAAPAKRQGGGSISEQVFWANGNDLSMCLSVTNGQFYDGSPVGLAPCQDSSGSTPPGQLWTFEADPEQPGVTSFIVAGQNYCLDFGVGGGSDGTAMKIWQCYPGLFQQTLYWTADQHLAVYNGNQCLDVERGTTNVQSYQCSGGDVQQLWDQPAGTVNVLGRRS